MSASDPKRTCDGALRVRYLCPKPVPHDRLKASIAGLPATHGPFVVALRQGLAGTGFVDDESRRVPCGRVKWIAGRPDAGRASLRGSDAADTAGSGDWGRRRLEVELGRAGQNPARACNFA